MGCVQKKASCASSCVIRVSVVRMYGWVGSTKGAHVRTGCSTTRSTYGYVRAHVCVCACVRSTPRTAHAAYDSCVETPTRDLDGRGWCKPLGYGVLYGVMFGLCEVKFCFVQFEMCRRCGVFFCFYVNDLM